MSRLFGVCFSGLLFGLVAPLASGQGHDEKSKGPAKQYSKPVRVNSVDFEIVAETSWQRPAEIYGVAGASIGLRLSNKSEKDLTFNLGDALRIALKSADGVERITGPVPKRFLAKPIKVAAGKSETVTLPTHLVHTRIGSVCLGLESDVGWNWLIRDVQPGKYRLCLEYENKNEVDDAWRGKMQTATLEIQVTGTK